jgi:hypothetical protein
MAHEDGGALSFTENSLFSINQCDFISCSSTAGYGGAFSSSSTVSGIRLISSCVFDQNSAYMNIGIDIYDSSNNSANFYSNSNVQNCISTSTALEDYIRFAGTKV